MNSLTLFYWLDVGFHVLCILFPSPLHFFFSLSALFLFYLLFLIFSIFYIVTFLPFLHLISFPLPTPFHYFLLPPKLLHIPFLPFLPHLFSSGSKIFRWRRWPTSVPAGRCRGVHHRLPRTHTEEPSRRKNEVRTHKVGCAMTFYFVLFCFALFNHLWKWQCNLFLLSQFVTFIVAMIIIIIIVIITISYVI